MLLDAVSTYSHSIIIPWTPNRVIMIWLNPLWRVNETSKEVVRGWWWDNKTQGHKWSKQVWLLRWISKRFVVKTLAPPVHRNLVDSVAVQILYPGQCLTCQTSEAYDIPIWKFQSRSWNFRTGSKISNPEIEIFRTRHRKLTKTSRCERVRWLTKINKVRHKVIHIRWARKW